MSIEYGTPVGKNFRIICVCSIPQQLLTEEFIFVERHRKVYHKGWVISWHFRDVMNMINNNSLYCVKKCLKYSFILHKNTVSNKLDYVILDYEDTKEIIECNTKNDILEWINHVQLFKHDMLKFRINGVDFPTSTPEEIESLKKHISKLRK